LKTGTLQAGNDTCAESNFAGGFADKDPSSSLARLPNRLHSFDGFIFHMLMYYYIHIAHSKGTDALIRPALQRVYENEFECFPVDA